MFSQGDIDHIEKQKEALTQELIRAETVVVEEEVDGKMVERTIVPERSLILRLHILCLQINWL